MCELVHGTGPKNSTMDTLEDAGLDNGAMVAAALVKDVEGDAEDHGGAPQQTRPVHGLEGDGDGGGEEGKDHDEDGP